MNILPKFAERLKELMDDNSVNPKELGTATEINQKQIYPWLSGVSVPSLKNLIKLADYFQCSVEFLAGIEQENYLRAFKPRPPFSERLSVVIKETGITIYRLAKITKIFERTIYDWLDGQYIPQLENLIKLADALKCTIDYLVGRE